MTKLIVTICLAVLLTGAALVVGGRQVAPGITQKGNNIFNTVTTATVNGTTGSVTFTAP